MFDIATLTTRSFEGVTLHRFLMDLSLSVFMYTTTTICNHCHIYVCKLNCISTLKCLQTNSYLSLIFFSLWSGVEPGGDGQEPALENCWMQCSVWGGPPSWLWLASFWRGLSHLHARVTSLLHWLIEVIPISRMQEQGVPNLGHFWGICSLHIVPMNHKLNAPRMLHNRLIY